MPRRIYASMLLLMMVWAAAAILLPHPDNPEPSAPAARIDRHAAMPVDVAATLRTSCFDCHSFETHWPWYTNVFPASMLLRRHVREGRAAMNLSEWAGYSRFEQADLLDDMCSEAAHGHMPPPSYLWLHRDAALDPAGIDALCDWTSLEAERLMLSTGGTP
ncbi:MAG: heme-binding domain-containing protein [Acidobacteriota bacterium]|jgi:hypothetical protein|nr:MAG: hypothetical protein DIU54_03885 [Acidobacteriota bacterium]